jgi:hypothetical protein
MASGLDCLNDWRKRNCLGGRNDALSVSAYLVSMAPKHDWYLKQWLRTLGKIQADVVRDLEWNKARVSLMASGKQPYDRDSVNELADYLHLRPYELLMHPDDAMALRSLRADAIRIANIEEDGERDRQKVSLA